MIDSFPIIDTLPDTVIPEGLMVSIFFQYNSSPSRYLFSCNILYSLRNKLWKRKCNRLSFPIITLRVRGWQTDHQRIALKHNWGTASNSHRFHNYFYIHVGLNYGIGAQFPQEKFLSYGRILTLHYYFLLLCILFSFIGLIINGLG